MEPGWLCIHVAFGSLGQSRPRWAGLEVTWRISAPLWAPAAAVQAGGAGSGQPSRGAPELPGWLPGAELRLRLAVPPREEPTRQTAPVLRGALWCWRRLGRLVIPRLDLAWTPDPCCLAAAMQEVSSRRSLGLAVRLPVDPEVKGAEVRSRGATSDGSMSCVSARRRGGVVGGM